MEGGTATQWRAQLEVGDVCAMHLEGRRRNQLTVDVCLEIA